MNHQPSVPTSYAGADSIHLHGGLLYEGNTIPSLRTFVEWSETLQTRIGAYLEGVETVRQIPVFHLTVNDGQPPAVAVRAEIHAVLGGRGASNVRRER